MQTREYIDEVMRYIAADESVKRRLSEDLYQHIQDAGGDSSLARMGAPKDMAEELMDTLYTDKSDVIRELIKAKTALRRMDGYEYVSKRKVFGVPLVHIRQNIRPFKPAKGIIAIGEAAVGVVAIGGFTAGIISIGGIAFGLLAVLGGLAVGGIAVGGGAVGLLAWGGAAIGYFYAFGGAAVASQVAIGGGAWGTVAIGGSATGDFTLATGGTSFNPAQILKADAQSLILQGFPNTSEFLLRLMTVFFG